MERIYRVVLLVFFVIGFVGVAASQSQSSPGHDSSPLISLIQDVRLAHEVNSINQGTWNQDVTSLNEDSLARVEALLAKDSSITTVQK